MNQIRKWGCHFDGRDPLSFLERVTELQEEYQYTDSQMKAGLPELLKGDALAWYRNEREAWETWADFTSALRRHYLPRRYQAKLMREIQERRQQPNEAYAKYATVLLTMMRRAGGFTQAEKVDRLYENLQAEYKLYVRMSDGPCRPGRPGCRIRRYLQGPGE
ncbi:activity-regulated cytoskeleton associated protein 2-like [Solenopsis invicta]|uniref:activity-regulated cytoskeleton associated protein 2-like n=1 Tax=Solenopsis invicta TaxID=13686 RepID=UPI00193DB39D|nr:activity-regulated cytoskeleton associated protein 2-like [Solenopsis invicta]